MCMTHPCAWYLLLLSRGGVTATPRKKPRSNSSWSGRGGAAQEINCFTNTTPSARNEEASRFLVIPRIHPSSAEEGNTQLYDLAALIGTDLPDQPIPA